MDEPLASPPPEPQAESAATTSVWARMMNVIAAPGEVFAEIEASPACTANWLLPAILLVVVGWVGVWLIFSQESVQYQLRDIRDKAFQKQVEAGKMTKDQAAQASAAAEKFGDIATKIAAAFGPLLAAFASPFWWALLLWLVGTKAFKADFTFMKAVEVAGMANIIGVLESIVKTCLILVQGSLFAGPNLAFFVPEFDPNSTTHGLLAAVDVMTFWALAVKGLGLAKLSGASAAKAVGCVFGLWALFTGLGIGVGLFFKHLFGM